MLVQVHEQEMYLTDAFSHLPVSIPTLYNWMRANNATHQQAFDYFLTAYKKTA